MQLTPEEHEKLVNIVKTHGTDIQTAVLKAYEEGILAGALRVGIELGKTQTSQGQQGGGDGDDEVDNPLTVADRTALRSFGIDPDRQYRHKNSVFTITGYKPSRWKYPVSITNQNGRKLKTTPSFITGSCRPV